MGYAIYGIHQPTQLDAVPEHNPTHDQEHDHPCEGDHKGNSLVPQSEAAQQVWDVDTNVFFSNEDTLTRCPAAWTVADGT